MLIAITILCIILCVLMMVMFVTGQRWDSQYQVKVSKVNFWIEVATAAVIGLIIVCFIFLFI